MVKKNVWIIANWKSNKTIEEALEWINMVGPKLPKEDNLKVVVCPNYLCLSEVKKAILVNGYPVILGAQDLSCFGVGAYTGEVAAQFLSPLVDLTILGHFERRKYLLETDEMIKDKVRLALEFGINPLVCVPDKNSPVAKGVSLVAFEPIFAIGSGKADSPQGANNSAISLKRKNGDQLLVLYGGSVDSENLPGFLNQPNLNGVLVGTASLNAAEFIKIVEIAQACP